MWSPRAAQLVRPLRAARNRAAVGAVLVLLAGCGFEPMYGAESDGSLAADLSQVQVERISDRVGQKLHNALRDRMNRGGAPDRPAFRLQVSVSENTRQLAIRKDETTARANLQLSAIFHLFDAETGATLMTGKARATSSYNVLDSNFATLSAERDAQNRAVRVLANEITLRVGGFLYDRRSGGG